MDIEHKASIVTMLMAMIAIAEMVIMVTTTTKQANETEKSYREVAEYICKEIGYNKAEVKTHMLTGKLIGIDCWNEKETCKESMCAIERTEREHFNTKEVTKQ